MVFDISGIPVAKNGDIITPDYHNSLRSALADLASQFGAVPAVQTISTTPQFLINGGGPNWNMVSGAASLASGETSAHGWFPITVPHGMRIQNLIVYGNRIDTILSFQVRLLRQAIVDGSVIDLVVLQLKDASSPFKVQGTVNVGGAGPAALEEFRLINNEDYNYLIIGRVQGAAAGATAQITTVQLTFSKV